jgi:hypothetical protein
MPSFEYGREKAPKVAYQEKTDCFAHRSGFRNYCNCLTEMLCKVKNCPFYKTEREYRLGLKHRED